jgi:hypothetical protein
VPNYCLNWPMRGPFARHFAPMLPTSEDTTFHEADSPLYTALPGDDLKPESVANLLVSKSRSASALPYKASLP